tara:strand:- start:83 stop:550 length:468 start_codon:yes stop_codon:yes gene_type:complete
MSGNNNPLNKIHQHLLEAQRIAKDELGVTNIFYNEAFIEAFMADKLNHKWNSDTQGGDAYEQDGTPTEYKAINTRSKSKGSFQFHWLSDNKSESLKQTNNMYFGIRDGVTVNNIYKVPTSSLIERIEEKCTKSKSTNGHVSFSMNQIMKMNPDRV